VPNRKELFSLVDFKYENPALSNTAGTTQWTAGLPFDGVRSDVYDFYWTSTTYARNYGTAWVVRMRNGVVGAVEKTPESPSDYPFVWPVRGGGRDWPFRRLVTAYYEDILGREPDAGGLNYWVSEINRMASLGIGVNEGFIALGKEFFKSSEYTGKGKSDEEYIRDLYLTFLQREPDQGGWDFWTGYLTSGASRDLVMNYFVFSNEFNTYMEGLFGASTARPENSLVNDFYRGLLGRLPDDSGFGYWLGQMRAAQCAGDEQQIRDLSYQIALLFIQSQEYADRGRDNKGYIEDLYDGIMRRSADPVSEVGYWVNVLNTMTRAQVLQLFTNSAEYQNRVTQVINAGCVP
jgi:hypothetical protein